MFQWIGPKRYRPPACSISQLPEKLDAVVISHTHYDHMDANSIVELSKRCLKLFNHVILHANKIWGYLLVAHAEKKSVVNPNDYCSISFRRDLYKHKDRLNWKRCSDLQERGN
jgi:L-ascorbate metabolism protein UlaG (beta-lactamase superfamily)